ncbi:FAD/NAD(P)-binding domain-containing protein [Hymenopellis radicata]|nr:FAD/NAD(P)-binding domain-containing protein [Hymenopellis radicata]
MSDESAFDVIIIGTGLVESITAAALSKAGLRIAHLDGHPYYGNNEASLSLDEFIDWCQKQPNSTVHGESLPQARSYSISLAPSVIPAVGPLISSLVSSGVSRYGGFRLVEKVSLYDANLGVVNVPGSKEDIFKSKSFSLVEKRRLMRFLMFASGSLEEQPELEGMEQAPFGDFLRQKFSLKEEIVVAIVYALAFCYTDSEPTLPTLKRLSRYLRSAGRYGASPFLVGHYGSSGELAQGFCRTAAVAGAVYILGRSISSVTHSESTYTLTLDDFPEPITCGVVVAAASSHAPVARCVAVVDQPFDLGGDSPLDTGILVFPPGTVDGGTSEKVVTALIMGEGTMSTPQGKWILYLSAESPTTESPEELLRPYLSAMLKEVVPLFSAFYVHKEDGVQPEGTLPLPDAADVAVEYAERVFWEVIGTLKKDVDVFWPPMEVDEEEEDVF